MDLEKLINRCLTYHLSNHQLLDLMYSGFRPNHSTETALIATTDNISMILDRGDTTALILLHLSAAFNNI